MSGFTELIRSLWCKLLLPVTTWNYHARRGWLESKIYPDASSGLPAPGSALAYTYKPSGRLLTRTWARTPAITTTYSYNAAGDLQGIDYSDSTPDVTTTYDRSGRPKTMTDASGTRTLSYHESGQLLDEIYSSGLMNGLGLARSFDSLNRLSGLSVPSLNSVTYSYDAASRLENVTAGVNSATYSYLTNSSLISGIVFHQSGSTRLTASKTYDNLNRLVSVTNTPTASSVQSVAYAYNGANKRTRLTRENGSYWDYAYDGLGQVISAIKHLTDATPVNGLSHAWTFDDIGNRKSAPVNAQASTYSANSLNQYIQRTVPGVIDVLGEAQSDATVTITSPATNGTVYPTVRQSGLFYRQLTVANSTAAQFSTIKITGVKNLVGPNQEDAVTEETRSVLVSGTPEVFTHDADGNLTADAKWTYTWDAENRLVAMETRPDILPPMGPFPLTERRKLEFSYDGQSRRIQKKVSSWNGSGWTQILNLRFIYDGWNLLAEVNESGAAVRSYAWGLDLSGSLQGAGGVGGLLFANLGSATHAPSYDGNANVISLTDMSNGTRSGEFEYGAFGEQLKADGPAADAMPFRFSTKYTCPITGLIYYGYRDYDPVTGRWPSRDPIEEQGGENLYGAVRMIW